MTSDLYIVGTLHAGLTPNHELATLIKQINPGQKLVEIAQDDIDEKYFDNYPSEMIYTYQYARSNNIEVKGFDSKMNVFKVGVLDKEKHKLLELQREVIGDQSWKDFNLSSKAKLLNQVDSITDSKKWQKREKEMAKNIRKVMLVHKKVLVITGCGHLDFFEEEFDSASFPLR